MAVLLKYIGEFVQVYELSFLIHLSIAL